MPERGNHQQLDRAPIIEVIIAFQCSTRLSSLPEGALKKTKATLQDQFSTIQESHEFESKFEFDSQSKTSLHRFEDFGPTGVRALDANPPTMVQHLTTANYSFNKLSPYTSLDDYLSNIKTGWDLYRDLFKPECVDRVSLRFVNRIPLAFGENGQIELSDYFNFVPAGLTNIHGPRKATGYYQTVQYSDVDSGDSSQVSLTSASANEQELIMVLDIEAVSEKPLPPNDLKELLPTMTRLRKLKNEHFYSKVTSKCLQLFQD